MEELILTALSLSWIVYFIYVIKLAIKQIKIEEDAKAKKRRN